MRIFVVEIRGRAPRCKFRRTGCRLTLGADARSGNIAQSCLTYSRNVGSRCASRSRLRRRLRSARTRLWFRVQLLSACACAGAKAVAAGKASASALRYTFWNSSRRAASLARTGFASSLKSRACPSLDRISPVSIPLALLKDIHHREYRRGGRQYRDGKCRAFGPRRLHHPARDQCLFGQCQPLQKHSL